MEWPKGPRHLTPKDQSRRGTWGHLWVPTLSNSEVARYVVLQSQGQLAEPSGVFRSTSEWSSRD